MSLDLRIRCSGKQPATTATTLLDTFARRPSNGQQHQNNALLRHRLRETLGLQDESRSSKSWKTELRSILDEKTSHGSRISISTRTAISSLFSFSERSAKPAFGRSTDMESRLLLRHTGNEQALTYGTVSAQRNTLKPSQKQPDYRHEPLNNPKRQIRLFRLMEERTSDGYLQGHLQRFNFRKAPRYTALSYTWKKVKYSIGRTGRLKVDLVEGPKRHLIIDGQRLLVNENLHDFLVIFHEITADIHVRWLWIDQVCIDQSRVAERNHQVGVMSLIYSQSDTTIAWLGIDDRGLPFNDHPYFKRQWIIQELILPKRAPYFLAGRTWISANEMMSGPRRRRPVLQHALSPEKHKGTSLELCLSEFSTECSEPRDYVYGFLGLLKPEQRPLVDYSKSLEEVFLDAVLSILNANNQSARTERSDDMIEQGLKVLFKKMFHGRDEAGLIDMESFKAVWWQFRASLTHSGVSRYAFDGSQKTRKITALGFEGEVWWHEYGVGLLRQSGRVYSCEITAIGTAGSAHVYRYDGEIYRSWPLPERGPNGLPLPISKDEFSQEQWTWFGISGKMDSDLAHAWSPGERHPQSPKSRKLRESGREWESSFE